MAKAKKVELVELGDRVKDKISKLEGVVVYITEYLYGCRRVGVQPEESEKGKPTESFIVDDPQLTIVKKCVIPYMPVNFERPVKVAPQHGDRPDVGQREAVPAR